MAAKAAKVIKKNGKSGENLKGKEVCMENLDQMVRQYNPLIKFIAQKLVMKLPPNIDIDDLMSAGVIGLMDAIEKYDCKRDNQFKTYAEFRIRGAMLDELRAQDWIPRSVREKAKQISRVQVKLQRELGRHPTDKELAGELEMSLEKYREMQNEAKAVSLLSIEDAGSPNEEHPKNLLNLVESHKFPSPLGHLGTKGLRELIIQAIEALPEKQRLVLSLYYYEDVNLKDIGRILNVTESRVSQLHTQAIESVRKKIEDLVY